MQKTNAGAHSTRHAANPLANQLRRIRKVQPALSHQIFNF